MQYRVEANEKFVVRTVYKVDAASEEDAEALCKSGNIAYDESEHLEYDSEWLETVSVDACVVPLPAGRLTLEFFENLAKGVEVRLYYHCFNEGNFMWRHDSTDTHGNIIGSFKYDGDNWSSLGDHYVYLYSNTARRGAGAEPLHAIKPTQSDRPL